MRRRAANAKPNFGGDMNQPTENRTRFLGTYFDRDAVLRVARLTGILAWVLLALYAYTTFVSIGQFWMFVASGATSYEGTNIFDRMSIPTLQISPLVPGLVYFIML